MVVSPDSGFAKQARKSANYLGTLLAIGDKERIDHSEKAEILEIIGDVAGKTALIVDDFTISGGTLVDLAYKLKERGATDVLVAISHGVFPKNRLRKLRKAPSVN